MKVLIIVKWLTREGLRTWLNPLKLFKRVNFHSSLNPLKFRVRRLLKREHLRRWPNPFKILKRENLQKWLNPMKLLNAENFRELLNRLKFRVPKWLKRDNLHQIDVERTRRISRYIRGAMTCLHVRVCHIEPQHAENMRKCCTEVKGVETVEFVDEGKDELIVKGWFERDDLRNRLLSRIYGGTTINRIIREECIAPNVTGVIFMVNICPVVFVREPSPWEPYTQENLDVVDLSKQVEVKMKTTYCRFEQIEINFH